MQVTTESKEDWVIKSYYLSDDKIYQVFFCLLKIFYRGL